MVATQASPPPPYRDIELGAPPPYEEATSRPPPYVPNEPATRLTIDDLVISIQTESVLRVDEVPAITSRSFIMIYSNDNKIEQASKNYEPTSPEQEDEAFEFILELPKIREKFQNFLEDKKLSRDRLVVGDILPDFDDILKEKGCQDFYTRVTYIGLMVLSVSIIIGYMNYNDNLSLNSIVLLSLITFAISFYQLTVHMVNRHYDMCDREYEVLPSKKLLELNEMLERELEVLADKFYKPIIDQLSANVSKDISAFIVLLATNESDELRYKHALSLGANRKANGAQYLKNVQLIDKGQFKSIRGCLKLLTSDLSLLYDAFMKNYSSLNLKLDKNLSNYY